MLDFDADVFYLIKEFAKCGRLVSLCQIGKQLEKICSLENNVETGVLFGN